MRGLTLPRKKIYMPFYRPRITQPIEAIQLPLERDPKATRTREIAVWLYEHGYREYDTFPEDMDPQYVHEGTLLAEFGTNFITLKNEEGDEVNAHLSDYIVDLGNGKFVIRGQEEFEDAYEEVS